MIKLFISSKKFQNFIATLIVINGIILGLATSKQIVQEYSSILTFLDNTIIAIFTIEIILRIYVHRLSFFKDPWSLFDFL